MLKHIDTTMTEVYWYVGKITYELSENSTKASYGKNEASKKVLAEMLVQMDGISELNSGQNNNKINNGNEEEW